MTWIKPRISQPKRVWFIKRFNFLTIVVKSAIRNHFTDHFKLKKTIRLKFFLYAQFLKQSSWNPEKITRKNGHASWRQGNSCFHPLHQDHVHFCQFAKLKNKFRTVHLFQKNNRNRWLCKIEIFPPWESCSSYYFVWCLRLPLILTLNDIWFCSVLVYMMF